MINQLNIDRINELLDTKILGKPLYFFENVSSTNEKLKEFSSSDGLTVISREQKSGHGRQERVWQSDKGGLYFSFYTSFKDNIPPLLITPACALGVALALSEYGDCKIKWPNDIVLNGKKICGIISHASIADSKICDICVGIGVNVNNESFKNLPYASSLKAQCGKTLDENYVFCKILKSIEDIFLNYSKAMILNEYKKYCVTLKSDVKIHFNDDRPDFLGQCIGITDDCALVVKGEGQEMKVGFGQVSVRGLYGYV